MTGKKISDLTVASALGDSDKLVVEQSGVAKSITGEIIKQDAVAGLDSSITATTGQAISAVTITDGKITASSKVSVGETNQNAFSNVKVGSSTIAAGSKTDTVELVAGTNVTLTPDTTNKKITIAASGGGSSSIDVFPATIVTSGVTATITLGNSKTVSNLLGSKPSALYISNYDSGGSAVDFNMLVPLNVDDATASTMRIDGVAYANSKRLRIYGTYNNSATTLNAYWENIPVAPKQEQIILVFDNWVTGSGGGFLTQTVSLSGITSSSIVWVSPEPYGDNVEDYANAKVYCSGQGSGTLTFNTIGTPTITDDIDVIVVWM